MNQNSIRCREGTVMRRKESIGAEGMASAEILQQLCSRNFEKARAAHVMIREE